jgi:SAM-dependent methyltransferase
MGKTADHEALQAAHYDAIAEEYEQHYSDRYSTEYRERFINAALLRNLDLNGKDVLDALCGSGTITGDLLDRGAHVTGLDISPKMMEVFRERWPQCEAMLSSILDTGLPADSFDAVTIVGGLHHLHPDVDKALDEIHRILRPGGYLCFMEPHTGSLPDIFRRVWYRFDDTFESNEAAVDVDGLRARNASRFEYVTTRYQGNIAFLLVLNSMIFRVPHGLKRLYAPPLLAVESAINRVSGKRFSCYVVAQWKKRGNASANA